MTAQTRSTMIAPTRLMLTIKSIDPSARLDCSEYTQRWYVASRIEVTNGVFLSGVSEHRDTPEDAIDAFMGRLTSVPLRHAIVVNADRDNRRHYRWNGAGFTEEPVEWLSERVNREEGK